MLRTSQCSVKKSSSLPLSLFHTRSSYRLYPRLLHSSRKSSESDALGSAAVAEDNEEPSYAASDSFKSFRNLDGFSTRRPETKWSVPVPGKKYPETGIRKIDGRKSVRITNSPLVFPDTSCPGQVPPSNAHGPADNGMRNGLPPRWSGGGTSDSGGSTPGSASISRYGRSQQSSYGPPPRRGNTGRATAGGDLDSKFGSRSTWGVRPAPKPAAAEGGAHDTQTSPSGPPRSWGSSGTESGVLGRRNPNTSSSPLAPRSRWNDPPPQQSFKAKEEHQRAEQARNISPFRISRTTDGRRSEVSNRFSLGGAQSSSPELRKQGSINYTREFDQVDPKSDTATEKGNQSESPSVKTDYSGLRQSIATNRESPIYSTHAPKTPDDIRTFEDRSRQVLEGTEYSPPTQKMSHMIKEVSAAHVPIEDKFPAMPEERELKRGEHREVLDERSTFYSSESRSSDATTTFVGSSESQAQVQTGRGMSPMSDGHRLKRTQTERVDTRHALADERSTSYSSESSSGAATGSLERRVRLTGLAETEEGSAEQRNVREEEAEVAGVIASDRAAEGLRTRPLTPAELEYERRQSAKAREKSRRREFDIRESAILEEGQGPLTGKAAKKAKKAKKREKQVEAAPAMIPLYLPEYISVANLARAVKMRLDDFIVQMQNMGFEDVSYDHVMNAEVAGLIAMEYGYEPIADTSKEEDLFPRPPPEDKSVLQPRPPIVTIMGHVDHGKTTLLDWLRKSSIVATEHGGITQHIGAFSVTMPSGKIITFLDTPGHSAFLSMRERGAHVTDIVILVVAADDSVKPQTIEAIKHAKAANVPIIVAVNKIDKEGSDIDGVKQDLAKNGVDIEDFGGDTQVVLVSGKTGQGMEELEEATVTLSEVLDMRAETDGPCEGWVLEAGTEKRGRVATVLVNRGTLRPGDIIVAGRTWARVRSLINEHGVGVKFAAPGTPVTVDGWKDQPLAGDSVIQAASEDKAKTVINFRMEKAERLRQAADMEAVNNQRRAQREKEAAEKEIRERALADNKDPDAAVAASEKIAAENRRKYEVVNFIVKGDVAGSVEAVVEAISPLGNEEVGAKVIRSSFGAVTEFDIDHAAAAEGYVLCFNLSVEPEIIQYARSKGVTIMTHNVIYRLVDEVSTKLSEKLAPLIKYSVKAEAEILQVFSINVRQRKTMPVAGAQVKNGNLYKHDKVRVLRDGEIIYDGEFESMKIFTKEATEVKKGSECGLGFKGWGNFQAGDMIQTYEILEEARTI